MDSFKYRFFFITEMIYWQKNLIFLSKIKEEPEIYSGSSMPEKQFVLFLYTDNRISDTTIRLQNT